MRIRMDKLQERTRKVAPSVYHSNYRDGRGNFMDDGYTVETEAFGKVIFTGRVIFVTGFWKPRDGSGPKFEFASKVYTNPTVRDLLEALEASMQATGDFHHQFYEGYSDTGTSFAPTCGTCGRGGDEEPSRLIAMHTGS